MSQSEVYELLKKEGKPMIFQEIAEKVNISDTTLGMNLARLRKDCLIEWKREVIIIKTRQGFQKREGYVYWVKNEG